LIEDGRLVPPLVGLASIFLGIVFSVMKARVRSSVRSDRAELNCASVKSPRFRGIATPLKPPKWYYKRDYLSGLAVLPQRGRNYLGATDANYT
jgi:hypothetical protein